MIYKLIFILFIIVFSIILIFPTIGNKKMEIVLNLDASLNDIDAIKKRFSSGDYYVSKEDNKIIVEGINLNDAIMNEVKIFPGVKETEIVPHWAEKAVLAKKINLGLDLQGGMHLVLRANFGKIEKKMNKELTKSDKNEITQQALELLRNRIDKFGVSEPSIRPRGNEAIEIQLPGVKNPKIVKKVIGTTGRVEYRLVDGEYSKKANNWLKLNYKDEELPQSSDEQTLLLTKISRGIKLPRNLELLFFYKMNKEIKKIYPAHITALEKNVSLAGNDISKSWVGQDEYGRLAVHFTTTPDGASKFAQVTSEKNHGKKLSIIIDDKVRSAPQINVQITTGQAVIQGDFTPDEVNTLARIIKEGALPVDLEIIEERTVGPSLGQDSIEFGINAIMIGFIGVMIFMIFYYKVAGIIADLGLMLNMIFMLALLSWLGFTLTLPGIAGFILTVGMAVDANVIIYERIKEELRNGKSIRMSVVNGFDRAFWTIFDANLTTLIAAFILSQFGTGPIKGFAVTLFIGIICSMFVALYITRFIYEIISLNKRVKKLRI
ncbi:MAG: protein translocase subunit SecD [Spirochaetota bacterium]|nr:protein translocase subunit SecD [Spirochaetota bacterium]